MLVGNERKKHEIRNSNRMAQDFLVRWCKAEQNSARLVANDNRQFTRSATDVPFPSGYTFLESRAVPHEAIFPKLSNTNMAYHILTVNQLNRTLCRRGVGSKTQPRLAWVQFGVWLRPRRRPSIRS